MFLLGMAVTTLLCSRLTAEVGFEGGLEETVGFSGCGGTQDIVMKKLRVMRKMM